MKNVNDLGTNTSVSLNRAGKQDAFRKLPQNTIDKIGDLTPRQQENILEDALLHNEPESIKSVKNNIAQLDCSNRNGDQFSCYFNGNQSNRAAGLNAVNIEGGSTQLTSSNPAGGEITTSFNNSDATCYVGMDERGKKEFISCDDMGK